MSTEYYNDEDTILNVDWDGTHQLYAMWRTKSLKVRYFKGNADDVAFVKGNYITKSNGNDWDDPNLLLAGEDYRLCVYWDGDWDDPLCVDAPRYITKWNGADWSSEDELRLGDHGKWYSCGFQCQPGGAGLLDDASDYAVVVKENDVGETKRMVYVCDEAGGECNWIPDPTHIVNVGRHITKKNGGNWEYTEDEDGVVTLLDGSNPPTRYYANGQEVTPRNGDYAIGKGKWYCAGQKVDPKDNDYAYALVDGQRTNWGYDQGQWRSDGEQMKASEPRTIYTIDFPYLTKKNGNSWETLAELNSGDSGKWYLDGAERTKRNGDYAIVKNPGPHKRYTYNSSTRTWGNPTEFTIDSDIEADTIDYCPYLTKKDGSNWNSEEDLNGGDGGKWYQDGEQRNPENKDLALVKTENEEDYTTYIYSDSLGWIPYPDDGSQYEQTVQKDNPATLMPNKFLREGFEFIGWSTQKKSDESAYVDVDLGTTMDNGTQYYQQFLPYNYQMGLVPTATREGYDFKGWFTSENADFGRGNYITRDITVYPRWQKQSEPTPTPTPSPEESDPTPEPVQNDGLDPTKFKIDPTKSSGTGLDGDIIYYNHCGGVDKCGNTIKNCKVFRGSKQSTGLCLKGKCYTRSKVYTHPSAPGKYFLKIPIIPGLNLTKINLMNGETVDIPKDVVDVINSKWLWRPGKKPPSDVRKKIPNWQIYDWESFGKWGTKELPILQWPGHEFIGWYLGYDGCHCKDPTVSMEADGKLYKTKTTEAKEDFFICTDYLQRVTRKVDGKEEDYHGFIFRPKFKDDSVQESSPEAEPEIPDAPEPPEEGGPDQDAPTLITAAQRDELLQETGSRRNLYLKWYSPGAGPGIGSQSSNQAGVYRLVNGERIYCNPLTTRQDQIKSYRLKSNPEKIYLPVWLLPARDMIGIKYNKDCIANADGIWQYPDHTLRRWYIQDGDRLAVSKETGNYARQDRDPDPDATSFVPYIGQSSNPANYTTGTEVYVNFTDNKSYFDGEWGIVFFADASIPTS